MVAATYCSKWVLDCLSHKQLGCLGDPESPRPIGTEPAAASALPVGLAEAEAAGAGSCALSGCPVRCFPCGGPDNGRLAARCARSWTAVAGARRGTEER